MRIRSCITLLFAAPLLACSLPCFSQTEIAAKSRPLIQPTGPVIATVAGGGSPGYYGDGGLAVNAALNNPQAVAFDAEGNYYIADTGNSVVRWVNIKTGNINTYAGGGNCSSTTNYCGDHGPATSAQLLHPAGLAFDKAGNLYIADSGNNAIRVVNGKTGIITTFAGNGTAGYKGDSEAAAQAELNGPDSIAFDAAGNLYIADNGNLVVRKVASGTGTITTFAGGGSGCTAQSDSIGDNCIPTDATFSSVVWVTFDNAGHLYIVDNAAGRVREVNGKGLMETFAGGATNGCSAIQDGLGDGCPAYNMGGSGLSYAHGATFDASGNAFLSRGVNNVANVIQEVSEATGIVELAVGFAPGYYSYGGDGGAPGSAYVASPIGMTFDAAGNLYFADSGNNSVRIVTYSSGNPTATPVLSLAAGTYIGPKSLTISDATAGAVIYYTTDGSVPTTSSAVYSGAIPLPVGMAAETVNALAVAPGREPSAIASATYLIDDGTTAAPVFSVKGGTYGTEQVVKITDATAGAVIYYTLDGSEPTAASPVYSGPITVLASETIQAFAAAPLREASGPVSAVYTLAGTPTVLNAPATLVAATSATLNALVTPLGVGATCSFEYGLTSTALTSTTKATSLKATLNGVNVSAAITGLTAKTTYYYRAVVTTVGGTATSAVESFTTE